MKTAKFDKIKSAQFFIAYTIMILHYMLKSVTFFDNTINTIFYAFGVFILALLSLSNILQHGIKKSALIIIISILSITLYVVTKDPTLTLIWLFVIAFNGIGFESLVRYDIALKILCITFIISLALTGALDIESTHTRGDAVRLSLGFYNPNVFSSYVLSIVMDFLYLRRKKFGILEILLSTIIVAMIFLTTGSRTQIGCILLINLLLIINKKKPNLWSKKPIRWIGNHAFVLITTISLVCLCAYFFVPSSRQLLNIILPDRIRLPAHIIKETGLWFFGNQAYLNSSIDVVLDNSPLFLLTTYGIAPLVIVCSIMTIYLKRLNNEKTRAIYLIMIVYFVSCISERLCFRPQYSLFVLYASTFLYSKTKPFANNGTILQYNNMGSIKSKIKKIIFYGTWLIKFSFLTFISLFISLPLRLSKKYKNLWLISERPDEARDNGYWLYRWILDNHPEVNVRYVLSKSSPDYKKMPRKDLIIKPGSIQHYICYILSSYSISTHMHGVCPGKAFCIPFLPFMRKKKTVFLQHGVTKNKINIRKKIDCIISVSNEEQKLLISANPNHKNNVQIAGFCRFDQLIDESKDRKTKIILVMPTFRKWLRDTGRLKDPDSEFKKTSYFEHWNNFLNNKKLEEMLSKNNLKLIFFPHYEIQKLTHNFKTKNPRIKICKPKEYDIQELLKKSSVLITDYSSVLFDFVYMNKPIIMYQFDQENFFAGHYKSSGKPYPFGDIFAEEEQLVAELENTIERNYTLKANYKKDVKNFYKYNDTNNCERNYNIIKESSKNKRP